MVATSEIGPDVPELPPAIVAAMWAVLHEALQNVERHAGAGSVAVTAVVAGSGGRVLLRVADDWAGLSPGDLERSGRHGVTGMRERAVELGGTLRVVPRPGGGTVVEAEFPLHPDQERADQLAPAAGARRELATTMNRSEPCQ